jgi:hypothetical protein
VWAVNTAHLWHALEKKKLHLVTHRPSIRHIEPFIRNDFVYFSSGSGSLKLGQNTDTLEEPE